ncbi:uncharacterized protein LOC121385633 [Gigantopelta aegis]|uniref:uncharacterized protein LOC121385633 n=1 Tax=Gigantopelta aegis TaxID=1735272 RepID=UPI001B88B907|nr:uncharacterized protein LOC121385633 [Gigantopelta aegis]
METRSQVLAASKRSHKKSSKKRPPSTSSLAKQLSNSTPENAPINRYHATTFPLFSGSDPLGDPNRLVPETSHVTSGVCNSLDTDRSLQFQDLPFDCKLKVFAYLSNTEKGLAAPVCHNWWSVLTKSPCLWDNVLFSSLPSGCLPSAHHAASEQCYDCYKTRVFQFVSFLVQLQPLVHTLEFKLDIEDSSEGFLGLLYRLFTNLSFRDLRYAHLNWKETPSKPFWLESATCDHCSEVIRSHRRRQRKFVHMFDQFTTLAPNVTTLVLPFEWSTNSVKYLGRLKKLRNLVLEKYFVFQMLPQHLLSRTLESLPSLQRLMLEVWTPSYDGLITYSLTSKSIEYLDISQSRGFYVQKIDMPRLKVFRVARHPWNGPIVSKDRVVLPCVYEVLVNGAPSLVKLNDHCLEPGWRDVSYPSLDEVFKSVCSCRRHRTGWALY